MAALLSSRVRRYAFALLVSGLALAPWLVVGGHLQPSPFPLFTLAVAATVWFAGLGPSLVVVLIGVVSTTLTYRPTGGVFPDLPLQLAVFLGVALTIVWLNIYRVRAREALEQSDQRLARVVDLNLIAIFIADLSGKILDANDAFLELTGFTRQDLEAQHIDWDGLIPPEYHALHLRVVQALRSDGIHPPVEKEYVRKDGSRIPVLLGARLLPGPREEAICFVLDLTEQRRIEAERAALTHQKDQFLLAVAHDLRTPLTVIKGIAQVLQRRVGRSDSIDLDGIRAKIATIDRTADRMTSGLNEFLDLARLDINRVIDLSYTSVDVVALVREVAAHYGARGTDHRIIVNSEAPELVGLVDAVRIERVMYNLLDNAAKYSPHGGDILVTLSCDSAGQAVVVVEDKGVGIPDADLPHIFDRFHRGSNVGQISGVGVGLAGVKQIIDQHGGAVAVQSREGAGTTVTVHIPLTPPGHDLKIPADIG